MSTPCTGSRQGAGTRGAGPPGKAREGRGRGNRPASNRPAGRSGRRNRRRRGSVRQPAGDRGVVGAVIEAQRPTGATRPPVRRGVSRKCLGSVEAAPVPAPSPGGRARAAREGARRRRRRGWRRRGWRRRGRRRAGRRRPRRWWRARKPEAAAMEEETGRRWWRWGWRRRCAMVPLTLAEAAHARAIRDMSSTPLERQRGVAAGRRQKYSVAWRSGGKGCGSREAVGGGPRAASVVRSLPHAAARPSRGATLRGCRGGAGRAGGKCGARGAAPTRAAPPAASRAGAATCGVAAGGRRRRSARRPGPSPRGAAPGAPGRSASARRRLCEGGGGRAGGRRRSRR